MSLFERFLGFVQLEDEKRDADDSQWKLSSVTPASLLVDWTTERVFQEEQEADERRKC